MMGAWKAGSTLAVKDVMESRSKRSDTMLFQLNGTSQQQETIVTLRPSPRISWRNNFRDPHLKGSVP
jgi:hypothetical protein